MLINGIICKWRDVNNQLLIKLMQNPNFMKSRYEIIAMITTWCDDGRVYENEICDRRFDFNPPKIISFGYIENNMSVIMDHPTKQQKKKN